MFIQAIVTSYLAAMAMAAPAVEAATTTQDVKLVSRSAMGSWCNEPRGEAYWGAATAVCCDRVYGMMDENRRCHRFYKSDVQRDAELNDRQCSSFYACCIDSYESNNSYSDRCY
jgi:hypothetical protein